MKRIYCLLGLALLSLSSGFAQENDLRNSKWFIYGMQLNFFGSTTTSPFGVNIQASVCDQNGNPLIVVKSSGTIWANGQDIGTIPSVTTSNNTIIVPKPKHTDRYYIITSSMDRGLKYTEVDLTHSTLTNTETTFNDYNGNPATTLGSGVCSTVHANGTDYWIIAHSDYVLTSYLVTENGINITPAGAYGVPSSDSPFGIKISPATNNSQKRIASIDYYAGISLRNFNDGTGEITQDDSSAMYAALQQRENQKLNEGIYTIDAEFSSDGSTLYCVDDLTDYGSLYAIQESGNISPIGEYGGFIAAQRGPDGNVYFLDGGGHFYSLFPDATGYPNDTGIFFNLGGSGFQQWAQLPQLVSIDQCLASPPTPYFSNLFIPSYICKGTALNTFPTTSSDGITGSWSPAPNNLATTTYTFTAAPGQCAVDQTNLTVVVNDQNTLPTFNTYPVYMETSVCVGGSCIFPTTSANGITGTWAPAFNNSATTTYTFTPNNTQCGATSTSTITIDQKVAPTFDAIGPICTGGSFTLPGHSTNGIYGSWSPAKNYTTTTTYTFHPYSGQCAVETPTTMTVTVTANPITPAFDAIPYVCSGMSFSPLPTISNDGIIGIWSPSFNNMATTTYSFSPNAGQCVSGSTQTMTIAVNPVVTPVFNDVTTFSGSSINYTLPPISTNGISGTWDPSSLSEGDNIYTFTPSTGGCVNQITRSIFSSKSKVVDAIDDSFTVAASTTAATPSVLTNDKFNSGAFSPSDVTVSFMSLVAAPGSTLKSEADVSACLAMAIHYSDLLTPDGKYHMYNCFSNGTYLLSYKIASCAGEFDTATATIKYVGGTSKKVQSPKQPTDASTDVITAYPNPSDGIFNIDLSAVEEDYNTIQVYNMLGAMVYQGNLKSKSFNEIDLTNMTTGFYIAQVSGNNGNVSFKLIKQ